MDNKDNNELVNSSKSANLEKSQTGYQQTSTNSSNKKQAEPQTVVIKKGGKFLSLMVTVALSLSGFAVYKMYEPQLFSTVGIEAPTSSPFVTSTQFSEYRIQNNKEIEALKVQVGVLQKQLDSNPGGISINLPPESKGFNHDQLKDILSYYVNYQALEIILNSLSDQLTNQLSKEIGKDIKPQVFDLRKVVDDINLNNASKQSQSVDPVQNDTAKNPITADELAKQAQPIPTDGKTTNTQEEAKDAKASADTTAAKDAPLATVDAKKLQKDVKSIVDQALQSEEFKVYIGTLIAQKAINNPGASNQADSPINQDLITALKEQLTSQINNQINQTVDSKLAASKEQQKTDLSLTLDKKFQQLASDLENKITNASQPDQHLQAMISQASNVLVTQLLVAAQNEISANASLDTVLMRLQMAQNLTSNQATKDAISKDIQQISTGKVLSSQLAGQISELILIADNLPTVTTSSLGTQDVDKQEASSFGQAISDFFSSFVTVRKVDSPAVVDESANLYIQQNIKIALQNALLAAQFNNGKVLSASLTSALNSLNKYYANNAQVQGLIDQLTQLQGQSLSYDNKYQLSALSLVDTTGMGLNAKPTVAPQVEAPAQPEASPAAPATPEATPAPVQPEATPAKPKDAPKPAPKEAPKDATKAGAN